MVGYRKKMQLTLGFVGFMFLVMLYQQNASQDKTAERLHRMQNLRKQLITELCEGDKALFYEGQQTLDDFNMNDLSNLLVDDKHGIIYCAIPRVASRMWKRVMAVLNQSEPYKRPLSIADYTVHKHITLLNRFAMKEIQVKLRHYTKFLFVRDPFVRLIGTYRDKLMKPRQYFFEKFGQDIMKRYDNQPNPPKTMAEAIALGAHPSFHGFVQYLIDPETEKKEPFEPHWRQMYHMCHPCFIKYDFVGHLETFPEDVEHLLKILRLDKDVQFPPNFEEITLRDSLMDWFRSVPLEDRRKLYKIYEADFRLFGYEKPDELFYV